MTASKCYKSSDWPVGLKGAHIKAGLNEKRNLNTISKYILIIFVRLCRIS